MSLLLTEQDSEFLNLTNQIVSCQLEKDHALGRELDEWAMQKMYQDTRYNVDFLYTALQLEEKSIFERYARWVYQLLASLMTYCSRERLRDIMVEHYECIRHCMLETVSSDKHVRLHALLDDAVNATKDECAHNSRQTPRSEKYESETKRYLDCLLDGDTRGAMSLITQYIRDGIPLSDICVDIISVAMRQVGDLWHRHLISVDTEHYCTSVTQMALSQFYPLIFGQERKGKSILVACVGSELHEMGARMVADLFEYNGWDSIYLGAAVPLDALISSIAQNQPDLIALSVTMPQHLPLCKRAVMRLRELYPALKIAVGGNAFADMENWKYWGADIYTPDARELVIWADKTL